MCGLAGTIAYHDLMTHLNKGMKKNMTSVPMECVNTEKGYFNAADAESGRKKWFDIRKRLLKNKFIFTPCSALKKMANRETAWALQDEDVAAVEEGDGVGCVVALEDDPLHFLKVIHLEGIVHRVHQRHRCDTTSSTSSSS